MYNQAQESRRYLAVVNAHSRVTLGETWIGPEELTYPSGTLAHSARRGMVRYPDGKVRSVVLGVPDTFFSIPARGKARGKTLTGFVSSDGEGDVREFTFHVRAKREAR